MADIIAVILLLLIVGGAIAWLIRARRKGTRCVGCPACAACSGGGEKKQVCGSCKDI